MLNRQDIVLPTCSLQLRERAYVRHYRMWQKMQKFVLKIAENLHFEIPHYAMPCQGPQ